MRVLRETQGPGLRLNSASLQEQSQPSIHCLQAVHSLATTLKSR